MKQEHETREGQIRELAQLRQRIKQLETATTEQSQVARTLEESRERYRSLIEHTHDAIFCYEYDPPILTSLPVEAQVRRLFTGELVECNTVAARSYGSERPEDVLGKRLAELFRAAPGGPVDGMFQAFIHNGYRIVEGEGIEELPDGSKRYFSNSAHGVIDSGKLLRVWGVFRDITERKEAEESLRYQATLLENVSDAVITTDLDFTIQSWNRAAEAMYGWSAADVIGLPIRQVLPTDYLTVKREDVLAQFQEEGVWKGEVMQRHRDGGELVVQSSVTLVQDSAGQAVSVVAINRDFTEQKRLRQQFHQSQKMEALGQLAGGVAHDFNNLLTVIHLNTQITKKKLRPGDGISVYLDRILDATERATGLIQQLLSFTRQEIVRPQVLDLNDVVAELNKMLRRVIGEDIELMAKLEDELWPVMMDPTQADQVLMNLAVNARDAMPHGGTVTIETTTVDTNQINAARIPELEPGQYVVLAVSDTGIGMSPEIRARIFEPFFTTKGPGAGTGLGLATVFGIVKQNGGDITVRSKVNKGTTFKIYLPRAHVDGPATLPSAARLKSVRGTETILVVEDQADVREVIVDVLVERGFVVLPAANGEQALQIAARHDGPIHMVLTDMVMPRMSGRELVQELTARYPKMGALLMSGFPNHHLENRGGSAPSIAFLPKPFTPETLTQKVWEVLNDKPEAD